MTGPAGLPFRVNGRLPDLGTPVMIMMLSGWIDASNSAAAAMEHLCEAADAEPLVEFDADTFMDFRARRPVMELREGVNTRIVWSCPRLWVARDEAGTPYVLLSGPEPDHAWNMFARTVAALAGQLHVSKAIGIGAYPYAAPHTRPIGLTATSPDPAIIERLTLSKNSLDVPAGIEPVIEHELHAAGVASMCIWAQVPHYVSSMAHPAASAALIDAVSAESGLRLDARRFHREAGVQRERLDQLVQNNPEHVEMLRKLELAHDEAVGSGDSTRASELDLPSVDEIAAEVEQFLRDQQTGG